MCSGYLKVHIAKKVFQTLNICQNNVIIICLTCYQTTGNSCNRLLDRYTCCHQRHCRCTNTCLRSRSIGFKSLRYCTDRIRELFFTRKYRYQCFLSQCSMSDLTTSRSSGRFCFTNRVRWEIIMMHITFACNILIQSVYFLNFR